MEQDIPRWLRLDPQSAVPPFEQVKQAVLAAAASGKAAVGTRLPPVRGLATHLGIAANTVARAYRELEQAGVVETRGRAGTVITAGETRRAAGSPPRRTTSPPWCGPRGCPSATPWPSCRPHCAERERRAGGRGNHAGNTPFEYVFEGLFTYSG